MGGAVKDSQSFLLYIKNLYMCLVGVMFLDMSPVNVSHAFWSNWISSIPLGWLHQWWSTQGTKCVYHMYASPGFHKSMFFPLQLMHGGATLEIALYTTEHLSCWPGSTDVAIFFEWFFLNKTQKWYSVINNKHF